MKLGLLLDLKAIFLQLADRKTKQVRFVELQCGAKMTEHIRQIAYRGFFTQCSSRFTPTTISHYVTRNTRQHLRRSEMRSNRSEQTARSKQINPNDLETCRVAFYIYM